MYGVSVRRMGDADGAGAWCGVSAVRHAAQAHGLTLTARARVWRFRSAHGLTLTARARVWRFRSVHALTFPIVGLVIAVQKAYTI